METTFYFCPEVTCIKLTPVGTNLNPPQATHVEESVTEEQLTDFLLGHIRLVSR